MKKIIWFLSALLILAIIGSVFFFIALPRMVKIPSLPDMEPEKVVEIHTVVLEEVKGLNKLELKKYTFNEILRHQYKIDWWPDPEVVLHAFGEVVACVDFGKLDSGDVFILGDTLIVTLPEPEICYSKIDHERSSVVETSFTSWYADGKKMIDQAYKISEDKMLSSAIESGILDSARSEAIKVLVPLLSSLSEKQVFVEFPPQKQLSPAELVPIPNINKPGNIR